MRGVHRGRVMCAIGAGVCLWTSVAMGAQESSPDRSRRPASGWAGKKDKHSDPYAAIQEKLKRILSNQQTILQKSETVKTELGIIKVRVTGSGRTLTLPAGGTCP